MKLQEPNGIVYPLTKRERRIVDAVSIVIGLFTVAALVAVVGLILVIAGD